MKYLLLAKGLWGLVDGTKVLGESAMVQQEVDFKKRSQKALYDSDVNKFITTLSDHLLRGPADAWTALRDHFEWDILVNKLILKKQFFRMDMKEGTSVEAYIKNMKELTDRLSGIKALKGSSCYSLRKSTS